MKNTTNLAWLFAGSTLISLAVSNVLFSNSNELMALNPAPVPAQTQTAPTLVIKNDVTQSASVLPAPVKQEISIDDISAEEGYETEEYKEIAAILDNRIVTLNDTANSILLTKGNCAAFEKQMRSFDNSLKQMVADVEVADSNFNGDVTQSRLNAIAALRAQYPGYLSSMSQKISFAMEGCESV